MEFCFKCVSGGQSFVPNLCGKEGVKRTWGTGRGFAWLNPGTGQEGESASAGTAQFVVFGGLII